MVSGICTHTPYQDCLETSLLLCDTDVMLQKWCVRQYHGTESGIHMSCDNMARITPSLLSIWSAKQERKRKHGEQNCCWPMHVLPLQADMMEILYRAAKQDGLQDANMAFQGLPKAKAVFDYLVAKPVQVHLQPLMPTCA